MLLQNDGAKRGDIVETQYAVKECCSFSRDRGRANDGERRESVPIMLVKNRISDIPLPVESFRETARTRTRCIR